MERTVHVFDNGIKVYEDHLLPVQRDRYRERNVHEADEEDIFLEILKTIPKDGSYVNIGSAIGYYPLLAKRIVPDLTVHVVEPLERHRAFFIENIALNGFEQNSFTIHSEGISSKEGEALFFDKGYGSSIQKGKKNNQSDNLRTRLKKFGNKFLVQTGFRKPIVSFTIKTKTLDSLCLEIGESIALCQIDVQGLELDVLNGAHQTLDKGIINTFLIGTHSQQLHDECINLLKKHHYIIVYSDPETKKQPDGIIVASKGHKQP